MHQGARRSAVTAALGAITRGADVASVESHLVDCKEDESGRGRGGAIRAGARRDEGTARTVVDALICFHNADGGAVILGVDDKGRGPTAFLGTEADETWLANRVWELTGGHGMGLVVSVEERSVSDVRLLALYVEQGAFPRPDTAGRYRQRIGASCRTMSGSTLGSFSVEYRGSDWSAAPTASAVESAHPAAMSALRDLLDSTGEESRRRLADRSDRDLLAALGLLGEHGSLTRAGELLVTRRADGSPLLDLSCRSAPGADTELRVDRRGLSLIEQLQAVEVAIESRNPVVPLTGTPAFARGEVRALPPTAVRGAIVNGLMHRDYQPELPVAMSLEGHQLIVVSPGGFLPGVTAENVLTAQSRTRNRTLATALRGLRLAEQEGNGVDRMYRELIRLGHAPPEIDEVEGGNAVRCAVVGGQPQRTVIDVIRSLPEAAQDDVDLAVILHELRSRPTVNAPSLERSLQKPRAEVRAALQRAGDAGLIQATSRSGHWRLADEARSRLGNLLGYLRTSAEEYNVIIARHLAQHGEIRARDLIELTGASQGHASRALRRAVEEGLIALPQGGPSMGRAVIYIAGRQHSG